MPVRITRSILLASLFVFFVQSIASATTLYVDNLRGKNSFNGIAQVPIDFRAGPVKTISKALKIATPGDTIVVANTGRHYYESISLVGTQHSRVGNARFTIVGNGAVVSGARIVPPSAWKKVKPTYWKMNPWRKGHFQLLLNEVPVPEHPVPAESKTLPDIPVGQWSAWKGEIYYRSEDLEEPAERPFSFAALSTGLTIYNAHGVLITGITFRHFRLDGMNVPDLSTDVTLENVKGIENGRAGLAVGGSAQVNVNKSFLTNNRRYSLLVTELGFANLAETQVSQPPKLRE